MQLIRYLAFVLCVGVLFADETTEGLNFDPYPIPWFTGPLLATSSSVVKPGHLKLQPYFEAMVRVSDYDAHWHTISRPNFYHLRLRAKTKFGIAPRLDFQFVPILIYNETEGEQSVNIGDMPVEFNLQLFRSDALGRKPAMKLSLHADLPIGKYKKLNPHKKKTDAMGSGCWFPGLALHYSDLWHISGLHYIEIRIEGEYRIGVPVRVKGFNTYGGDKTTHGTEIPGNYGFLDAAIQYNLTQNWALACDFRYEHNNRDRFTGKTTSPMIHPSKEVYSLAPAIEYNWSKNLGVLGGVWFSAFGRNAPQFMNGMISLAAYF